MKPKSEAMDCESIFSGCDTRHVPQGGIMSDFDKMAFLLIGGIPMLFLFLVIVATALAQLL